MKKDVKILDASIGIGFYSLFSLLLFLIINIFVSPIQNIASLTDTLIFANIITILLLSFAILSSIAVSILILTYSWENQWCKDNKLLWGLLSLLLLPLIGLLVFGFTGRNKLNSINDNLSIIDSQYKQSNSIIALGFSSLAFLIISIYILLLPITLIYDPENSSVSNAILICTYASLSCIGVLAIINIIASIMVLATNWDNGWAKENKLLWGLLSLSILTFIGILIFGYATKKELEKNNDLIRQQKTRHEFSQINSIMIVGFVSIVLLIGFIICFALIEPSLNTNDYYYRYTVSNIVITISTLLVTIFWIMNSIASIIILVTNWESEWANKNKLLWGLLSLLLLTFIGLLIFSFKARKNYLKDYPYADKTFGLSTYEKIRLDFKRIIPIILLGVLSFLFLLGFSIVIPINIALPYNTDDNSLFNITIILIIIFPILGVSLNIAASILILSFKWENPWSKKYKLLMGLLSLFLILFIGIFVFIGISLKETSKELKNTNPDKDIVQSKAQEIY